MFNILNYVKQIFFFQIKIIWIDIIIIIMITFISDSIQCYMEFNTWKDLKIDLYTFCMEQNLDIFL